MKHWLQLTALLLVLAVLVSCAKAEETPAWQGTLPNSGVVMTVSGGEVAESETFWCPDNRRHWQETCLLTAPHSVTLTWQGVSPEQVSIAFANPDRDGFVPETDSDLIEKVDYTPCVTADGALQYRIDTAYCFIITVSTERGTDFFLLDCRREI